MFLTELAKSINTNQAIELDEMYKLTYFNTAKYWHCWYDPETKILYNQYGRIALNNAYSYLLEIGMINENNQKINQFEN